MKTPPPKKKPILLRRTWNLIFQKKHSGCHPSGGNIRTLFFFSTLNYGLVPFLFLIIDGGWQPPNLLSAMVLWHLHLILLWLWAWMGTEGLTWACCCCFLHAVSSFRPETVSPAALPSSVPSTARRTERAPNRDLYQESWSCYSQLQWAVLWRQLLTDEASECWRGSDCSPP